MDIKKLLKNIINNRKEKVNDIIELMDNRPKDDPLLPISIAYKKDTEFVISELEKILKIMASSDESDETKEKKCHSKQTAFQDCDEHDSIYCDGCKKYYDL